MGRKEKGSHRVEWSISKRIKQEINVTPRTVKSLEKKLVESILPSLGRLPLSPDMRLVFVAYTDFVLGFARSYSGTLLLHFLHRDEAAAGGMLYRAYLSPLMTARGVDGEEVRETVENCLSATFPNPRSVPELPAVKVCSRPEVPWQIDLYRRGECLHLFCYYSEEPDYGATLDGHAGGDPTDEVVDGVYKPVVSYEPVGALYPPALFSASTTSRTTRVGHEVFASSV